MIVVLGWFSASILGLVIIYVINNSFYRTWSTVEIGIYDGQASFSWALCLAWVVLACHNGYGGKCAIRVLFFFNKEKQK